MRGFTDGWANSIEIGDADAQLGRVVAHWLNLPAIYSPERMVTADGRKRYTGRLSMRLGDWAIILDRRHDHKDVYRAIRDDGTVAITHVMEIRRLTSENFTPAEIELVLDTMQLGLSFGLGRWVAPALPVGFDSQDRRAWEKWSAPLCTAGSSGAPNWWYHQASGELIDLLELLVRRFADPAQRFSLRFLLSSAVTSTAGAFMEQRIATVFAAIEHLMWIRLVTIGGMSKSQFERKDFHAHMKLSQALAEAGIPDELDADGLAALRAAADRRPSEVRPTGAAIICHIRNLIVHPTDHEEELYGNDDLVLQAWLLARHYLVLLILHHLGYTGGYQRQLKLGGVAGDVEPVPWAPAAHP